MRDAEAADIDLSEYLPAKLQELSYPSRLSSACKPKSRDKGNELSCIINANDGAHTFYAIRTKDSHLRFVHVLASPSAMVILPQMLNTKRILDASQANVGRAGLPPDQPHDLAQSASLSAMPSSRPPQAASNAARGWGDSTPDRNAPPGQTLSQNEPTSRNDTVSRSSQPRVPAEPESQTHTESSAVGTDSAFQVPLDAVRLRLGVQIGVGGMASPTFLPFIFFKDGWVTDDLSVYPTTQSEFDQWKRRKPRAWGRWTVHGDTIQIQWNDPKRKHDDSRKWLSTRPGAPGLQLSGRYRSLVGGGDAAMGGETTTAGWNELEFQPGNLLRMQGGAMASVGARVGATAVRKPILYRYQLDGYQIRLKGPDGQEEVRWFYLYPDSDNVFGMRGAIYTKRR
jgi:hypothetical protein|nr:hypothetical protein [Bryobacterales bacterium]